MEKLEHRAVRKKRATGYLIWRMSPGMINYSTETSSEREASTNGFLHSKRLLRARDGTFSASTKLLGS